MEHKPYTVRKGGSYKASFKLGFLEAMVGNEEIASRLRRAGFENVVVWGSGAVRYASADWNSEDATAPLPVQVHEIIQTN